MRSVSSKIYTKDYYLNSCCGFEIYNNSKGKKVHPRFKYFVDLLQVKPSERVLDLGCGRGDLSIEIAKRKAKVTGIDYSNEGIKIANSRIKNLIIKTKKYVDFKQMDAKNLKFSNNEFDAIISIDIFEHLYKEELDKVMSEIYRVLKPGGRLIVHTETNKIYLNFTHRYWSYPLDWLIVKMNNYFSDSDYPGLPKDPRNDLHKKQHVNEPTYFYLKNLFAKNKFDGKIYSNVPKKPEFSWKDKMYNIIVSLSPFSNYLPLSLLFAHDYLCVMDKNKS